MTDLEKLLDEATKGPWEAAIERGCHGVIAHTLPAGGANFVAIVGNNPESPEKEPSRFANARLIALAPDLASEVLRLREREAVLVEALAAISAYVNEPSKDFRDKYPDLSGKIEDEHQRAKEVGITFMPEVVICDYARAALDAIREAAQ